jgi:hypothetical protein
MSMMALGSTIGLGLFHLCCDLDLARHPRRSPAIPPIRSEARHSFGWR